MYFLRSRRRPHRRLQAAVGARSATRSSSSAATACGTATCTPTTSARRSRSRSTWTAGRSRSGSPTCSRRSPTSTPTARGGDGHGDGACTPAAAGVRSRPVAGSRRSRPRSSPCAAATGSPSCSPNLGVQGVVTGGQTLNPSTAELLDTVEHVNADQVVILPNNKNIIPVAEQVDALTTKTVVVVPTRSMPEALAALVVYDPEASARRQRGRDDATPPSRSPPARSPRPSATRNSEAGPINEGDWIGIVRGDGIVAVAADVVGAAIGAARPARRRRARAGHGHHRRRRRPRRPRQRSRRGSPTHAPTCRSRCTHGGQPLYPYLFGVE